jgi:hypothetical protein
VDCGSGKGRIRDSSEVAPQMPSIILVVDWIGEEDGRAATLLNVKQVG